MYEIALIGENRVGMIKAFERIKPTKILTFSLMEFSNQEIYDKNICVIMPPNAWKKQKIKSKNWSVKTNSKQHSKIAIGSNGLIVGSWNFSGNSTSNLHETIIVFEGKEFTNSQVWFDANKRFDMLWDRSRNVQ